MFGKCFQSWLNPPQLEAEQIDKQELARSKIDALKVSNFLFSHLEAYSYFAKAAAIKVSLLSSSLFFWPFVFIFGS